MVVRYRYDVNDVCMNNRRNPLRGYSKRTTVSLRPTVLESMHAMTTTEYSLRSQTSRRVIGSILMPCRRLVRYEAYREGGLTLADIRVAGRYFDRVHIGEVSAVIAKALETSCSVTGQVTRQIAGQLAEEVR